MAEAGILSLDAERERRAREAVERLERSTRIIRARPDDRGAPEDERREDLDRREQALDRREQALEHRFRELAADNAAERRANDLRAADLDRREQDLERRERELLAWASELARSVPAPAAPGPTGAVRIGELVLAPEDAAALDRFSPRAGVPNG